MAGSAGGNRSPYEIIADRLAHKRVVSFPLTDYTSFGKGGAAVHIKTATFIKSGTKPDHYPPEGQPEIAFAGRSNVGKSSLINVLVNRKNLVRTSSTPGRTQLVNFFEINGGEFTLVDLPGYGFAKVPLAVKAQWGPMMETYLATRKSLKGVVLILDIRRTPSVEDRQMLDWLRSYDIPPLLVVTKCDKVSKNEKARQVAAIAEALEVSREELSFFSALSREGKDKILARIGQLLTPEGPREEPEPQG